MSVKDFLVEVGCAELPPKALKGLSDAFIAGLIAGLNAAGLSYNEVKAFTSPRRLAARVEGLVVSQADSTIERTGPAVSASFDSDGRPTPAALGFARSCGVELSSIEHALKDGTQKLVFRTVRKGDETSNLLPGIVMSSLQKLPIPRKMRWGSTRDEFVRPVYWLVMLFGETVLDTELFGIRSGRVTRGHRFLCETEITINQPAEYESLLLSPGFVIADYDQRKSRVRELILEQGKKIGALVHIDEDLLEEVTSMVEWPVALTGKFDEHFLSVPPEALVSSMKNHQKTFYVTDSKGKMLPYFIAVANIESTDPAQVIAGNERVIRPRLADAAFFFDSDRKTSLASRLSLLGNIVFQQQLGTVEQKSRRVAELSAYIAGACGGDIEISRRSALLAKCDLLTNMVSEFPELQGIMGSYYARHDGEPEAVSLAITEQYLPKFAGDAVPASLAGATLAVAEKIDTICGLFAIGQPPTGSKDPFALRRAALGVLRILVEKSIDLDLQSAIMESLALYKQQGVTVPPNTQADVLGFMLERFRAWYMGEGITAEVFQSVMELKPTRPLDFANRVAAVNRFSQLTESASLSAANKRVSNILGKHSGVIPQTFDVGTLVEPSEKILAERIIQLTSEVGPLFDNAEYALGLEKLSVLRPVVDEFFENVLVMVEDSNLRDNRLALLNHLRLLFLRVADISCLHAN
ncbi:glycine--tRNA ligase subunit beta [Gammaproteobacteria bacterium LSUCC0112]|nr:glycine--tRNA ligase subunit beta [Gammaproteobacteria bacterium LSUCC0112]